MYRKKAFFSDKQMAVLADLADYSQHKPNCLCYNCRSETATVYISRLNLERFVDALPDDWPFD